MKTNISRNLARAKALLLVCILWQVSALAAFAQSGSRTITGKVIDDTDEPLIGVSVLVAGTSVGTITDFDGNYSIAVPEGTKELQFSYIGYSTQTVAITGNVLNVRLQPDSQMLSDVVVIGYGLQHGSGKLPRTTDQRQDFGCADYVEQRFPYRRKHNPRAWRCFAERQQRPAYRARRSASRTGRYQRKQRKLPQPHQPERHRKHDYPERRFVDGHLWFARVERCHHHHHEERQFRQAAGVTQHDAFHPDPHETGRHARL